MRHFYRPALCVLSVVAAFAALRFEPAIVSDLVAGDRAGQVKIGAIRVPFWNAAFAQSHESLTLENVHFASGNSSFEAKRIDISGLVSSRADLDALLSEASTEPLETRLRRISAKQMTIPDLKSTQRFGAEIRTTTYKNVILRDILSGRIAEVVSDTAGAEIADGQTRTNFSYGRFSVGDLDLPGLARLYEAKAAPGPSPLTKIHGPFSIDNFDLVDGNGGVQVAIARISGRDFMARTIPDSWLGATTMFSELAAKDKLTDDERRRLIATTADFLGAFDMGLIEATGFEMKMVGTPQTTARIAHMSYSAGMESKPADLRIEGLEIRDAPGHLSLASASLTGFSIAPSLEGLRKLADKSLDEIAAVDARNLAPTIGTLKLSGLAIDVPADGDGSPPARLRSSVREIEFTADQPVNNLPTNLQWAMRNFAVSLPEKSDEDGIRELLALGYRNVDLSLVLAARWNEAAGEIVVRELSLQGKDMGTVALTGTFGGISKDVFDADNAVATVALMEAKAKTLHIEVENTGLFERFLARTAKEQKTSPDSLRQAYGAGAAFVVPSLIGNSEQAKAISRAVARFIAKPQRLTISARAKDPSGLGLLEMLSLSDPKAALEKLDVTAVAE